MNKLLMDNKILRITHGIFFYNHNIMGGYELVPLQ
jgi:hypothetical protein